MEKKEFIKLILKLANDAKEDKEKMGENLRGYFEGKESAYALVAEWLKDVYCQ